MFLDPLHNLKLGNGDNFQDLLQHVRNVTARQKVSMISRRHTPQPLPPPTSKKFSLEEPCEGKKKKTSHHRSEQIGVRGCVGHLLSREGRRATVKSSGQT